MRGLVAGNSCAPAEQCGKETPPTLMFRLNEREARLTRELEEIRKAKEVLARNPEFLELIDSVQRIGIY